MNQPVKMGGDGKRVGHQRMRFYLSKVQHLLAFWRAEERRSASAAPQQSPRSTAVAALLRSGKIFCSMHTAIVCLGNVSKSRAVRCPDPLPFPQTPARTPRFLHAKQLFSYFQIDYVAWKAIFGPHVYSINKGKEGNSQNVTNGPGFMN